MALIETKLSKTVREFVFSKETINLLEGAQGQGKTFGASIALYVYADEFAKYMKNKWAGNVEVQTKMPGVIVRDSLENIKRHTIPSMRKALPGLFDILDDNKKMVGANFEVTLLGLGEGSDLAKMQFGAEYNFGWMEEPAPMLGNQPSAGLSEEVFDAMIARCARASDFRPRIQITMNPPEESHWTYREFYEYPRFPNPKYPSITFARFHLKWGDNKHLTTIQQDAILAAFDKNPALRARFIEAKPALTYLGQLVCPEYHELDANGNPWHRAPRGVTFIPVPGLITYRFWDGGHNPSCVFCQWHPVSGQFLVLDTLRGDNMGMFQFIEQMVKPLISQRYTRHTAWRDIGDDSIANRDQSNTEFSAARTIERLLRTTFERGEKLFKPRREALKQLCTDTVETPEGTRPKLLLSFHEVLLHRGLSGGYHFHKDSTGKINDREAVKNIHSHPCDAFTYGVERVIRVEQDILSFAVKDKRERAFIESYA